MDAVRRLKAARKRAEAIHPDDLDAAMAALAGRAMPQEKEDDGG